MTDFVFSDTDFYQRADISLHAGITRKHLQDNLLHCYEQSGYDLDTPPINATAITFAATTSWSWANDYLPHAIPIYPKQGDGFRTYTIGLHMYSAVEGSLRVYLTQHPTALTLDSTNGEVGGYTSYGDYLVSAGVESYVEDTISIQNPNWKNFNVGEGSVVMYYVFPKICGKRNSAGNIEIHGMRIKEQY
jgi:hypothetical protein